MIAHAKQLKTLGVFPQDLQLWAVSDPYKFQNRKGEIKIWKAVDDVRSKIDAGATTIVTQPPYLRGQYMEFLRQLHRQGLTERAQIKIGVPLITNPRHLAFWFKLTPGPRPWIAYAFAR